MTPRQPVRNQRNSSRKQRKQQHLLDVKVRSRAATRQRNRRVFAWLSALLLFCAAVGGVAYGGREALRRFFWQNPDYNLAEVDIHTDGALTRDQILQATNIHEGKNIFGINLSTARKGVMALPQVDRVEIERLLPNKISIDIAERKPVAWVADKDSANPAGDPGAFLIDHSGMLMRVKTEVPDYYHLPVVCGVAVQNYEEGEAVDMPEMKSALELIRLTGENPTRYQLRSIDISKGYCMVVTDERHAKITFPLENLSAQLDRLALLFANIDASKREIQTVNLLVQRNVPVTFAPPPDPNPSSPDAVAEGSPSPSPSSSAPPRKPQQTQQNSATDKVPVKRAQLAHKSSTPAHHAHAVTVRRAIPLTPFTAQP